MAAMVLMTGCLSAHQATAVDVPSSGWHNTVSLSLPNADTTTSRTLQLFLRCDQRFREDTLSFRIATFTPDSLFFEERFTAEISRTATAAAYTREYVVSYRRRVRFGREGDYRVEITPLRPVEGIEAIGINIVKCE